MSRFRAAGIHLALSVLVAVILLAIMLLVWYPGGFFKLMGGGTLLFIIMGIDVCLGPLLTLAVFKSGKKSLKFDLSVIAVLQFSALIYGMSVMFQARPVFTVFMGEYFKVVTSYGIASKDELIKAKYPEFQHFSLAGPVLAAVTKPTTVEEHNKILFSGHDWDAFPKLYEPYANQKKIALKNAQSLILLTEISPENKKIVDRFLMQSGKTAQDFVYLSIKSDFDLMTAILDAKTGDWVGIIEAYPDKKT